MFNQQHPARTSRVAVAEAEFNEFRREESAGPLDGELLDLYAAILIVVPAAVFLRSVLF